MFEVGRLCVKTAGRDAGRKCVVTDVINPHYVMIDGETRRRKCNIAHLEPLATTIKIAKGASHEEVQKEFEKLGLQPRSTKPKQKAEKPVKKTEKTEEKKVAKSAKEKTKKAPKAKAAPEKKAAKK